MDLSHDLIFYWIASFLAMTTAGRLPVYRRTRRVKRYGWMIRSFRYSPHDSLYNQIIDIL
jgi:hypothetical protein